MKKIILLGILFSFFFTVNGQNRTDSIEVKNMLGPVFRQDGRNLTPRQLLDITKSNPDAYSEMKIAKKNYGAGYVLGAAGGFMIGWPLGTALGGGDPNWAMAAVGAGLVGISIPFTIAYNKHAKNAVAIYNKGLRYSSLQIPEIRIGLTYNGIGLKIRF